MDAVRTQRIQEKCKEKNTVHHLTIATAYELSIIRWLIVDNLIHYSRSAFPSHSISRDIAAIFACVAITVTTWRPGTSFAIE